MRTPKILTGKAFDWQDGAEWGAKSIDLKGKVNWQAAFFADPGVTQCPKCKEHYWNEGDTVECLDCGEQWETPNGKWKRERAALKESAK